MQPHEPEHTGPIWKHPYLLYVAGTAALFALLLALGYVAYRNGAIPDRGIGRSGAR